MTYRHIIISLLAMTSCLAFSACSDDEDELSDKLPATAKGTFTDPRDGNTYRWVRYGNMDWMAENFRYDMNDHNKCRLYGDGVGDNLNNPVNPDQWGRLYTHTGAVEACPDGWRLPTDDDWKALEQAMGMSKSEADKLDWRGNVAKRMMTAYGDSCDLNLQLGGYYTSNQIMAKTGYKYFGTYCYYWASTTDTDKGSSYFFMRKLIYNSAAVNRQSMTDDYYLSVRYVRDAQ